MVKTLTDLKIVVLKKQIFQKKGVKDEKFF